MKRLLCWLYGVDKAELDKIAQARPIGVKWSEWAVQMSRLLGR